MHLTDKTKDSIAWLFVLICPAFFASNMLIARGMSGIFPPIAMAFSRWFLVGLVVFLALAIMRSIAFEALRKDGDRSCSSHLLAWGYVAVLSIWQAS